MSVYKVYMVTSMFFMDKNSHFDELRTHGRYIYIE